MNITSKSRYALKILMDLAERDPTGTGAVAQRTDISKRQGIPLDYMDHVLSRLREAISINHFIVGIIKAPFMAFIIGIIACAEGAAVQGSAESLGQHTTASVVKSIFFVIVVDGIFAIYFASIGI